jgi:hypothetical protein
MVAGKVRQIVRHTFHACPFFSRIIIMLPGG